MEIQELLSISIVGGLVSVLLERITNDIENKNTSKLLVIVASLVFGGVYVWVRSTPYFATVLTILASSSAVFAFFFNRNKAPITE